MRSIIGRDITINQLDFSNKKKIMQIRNNGKLR